MRKFALSILFLFIVFLSSCILYQDEHRDELGRNYYYIDHSSILEEIEQANLMNLIEVDGSRLGIIDDSNLVFWGSKDFFEVMNTFHSLIWVEENAIWKISYVSYDWSCSALDSGPQSASTTFFQAKNGYRYVSEIYLHPTQNFVSVVRSSTSPIVNRWNAIDFTQIHVSPEDALTIAEENGGFDFRSGSENQCIVSIFYNTSLFNGWQVLYSTTEGSPLIIRINPKTGKIIN